MKKQLILSVVTLILGLQPIFVKAQAQSPRLLRHIVMITFKEGAPAREIKEVDDSFKNLADKLRVVKGFEMGSAIADGKNKAVTHVYSFGFASERDLADYEASPEHQKHIKIGTAIIEKGQAVDYWVEP